MWFQHDGTFSRCSQNVRNYLDVIFDTFVDIAKELVAIIAVDAGEIGDMPGMFQNVHRRCEV